MQAFAIGYTYSKLNVAAWFSIVILLVYVGMATIFVTLSIGSGLISSWWESATELMPLALVSPVPEDMSNTAAGASTIKSYSETYCVVAEGDRVQLRQYEGGLTAKKRIQPNIIYG
jgi:hypothetical protein